MLFWNRWREMFSQEDESLHDGDGDDRDRLRRLTSYQ
jgi:hypothetical protein